jgi:hypothetical protein
MTTDERTKCEEMGALITRKLNEVIQEIDDAKNAALALSDPFINKVEAAKFLNISVGTLEKRMAEDDGPPRYRDGGKVSFRRSELVVWRRRWRVGDRTGLEKLDAAPWLPYDPNHAPLEPPYPRKRHRYR